MGALVEPLEARGVQSGSLTFYYLIVKETFIAWNYYLGLLFLGNKVTVRK